MAEREGFELSIQFLEPRKSPHVRELHPILQQQHTVGEWGVFSKEFGTHFVDMLQFAGEHVKVRNEGAYYFSSE